MQKVKENLEKEKLEKEQLEKLGKFQAEKALKNVGLDPEEMLGNNAEPIKDYPEDLDDDSELYGHNKNEPWGYVR
ncbi:MAG: hypothetical protein M1365_00955 [Actinobacteria bacterium]|nr:hypothetical protein [Actinomycetota bacterium]